jgi:hypothetical protein
MTLKVDPTVRYAPHPELIENRLGQETVMLHLGKGIYFGLNEVGTIVWERLHCGGTPEEICAHVRGNFGVVPDTFEDDIMSLLAELLEKNLIEARN